MVKFVTAIQPKTMTKAVPPVIVELVGPAGAGKTTLSRALMQTDAKMRIGADIQLRNIKHIPHFVRNIPFSMPVLFNRQQADRWLTWAELKYIAYLRGWPHMLRQDISSSGGVILLDHGPLFRMATLFGFGPDTLKRWDLEQWWKELYKEWAFALDVIVWLDTADEILVERINARNQRHDIKGKSEIEAQQYLARYRASYMYVLAKLKSYRQPTLLKFDTSQVSIEQISSEILAVCSSKLNANGF